jgi:hypothetical protein
MNGHEKIISTGIMRTYSRDEKGDNYVCPTKNPLHLASGERVSHVPDT